MSLPSTIHASVGQSLIGKVSRLFNNGVADVLAELLQNARRAGASEVDIDVIDTEDHKLLVLRDNGSGIDDPAKILTLGDSGWSGDIARSEDPAGMGVFSLAGRHVEIRSYSPTVGMGWRVVIPPEAWESGEPLSIEPCDIGSGTEIRIDMPEAWQRDLPSAASNAARHYPLPVRYRGDRLDREDFLAGACRIEEWQGCRIGIYRDRGSWPTSYPRINFHGLTVLCQMPSVTEVGVDRCWQVRVDILESAVLHLVLPARKEMVQNAALENLREAAERAIYRTIAERSGHRLAHAQWLRARDLGVDLGEAESWLPAWFPHTAEGIRNHEFECVRDVPMILFPEHGPAIEQCAARVLQRGDPLGGTLVSEVTAFAGYRWYDRLPRIANLSFAISTEAGTFRCEDDLVSLPGLVSGRVTSIALDAAVSLPGDGEDAASHVIPADVLILPDDGWSCDLDTVVVLLTQSCTIDPEDLAILLEDACFCAGDDADNDSWETQWREFRMRARQVANTLLLGEDAAILERIRDIVSEEVAWLIPAGRKVTILTGEASVELSFADDAGM